ncbi:MAG: septal ring lytic transglycosylase RlpA family protein [Ramlibacter sp.]
MLFESFIKESPVVAAPHERRVCAGRRLRVAAQLVCVLARIARQLRERGLLSYIEAGFLQCWDGYIDRSLLLKERALPSRIALVLALTVVLTAPVARAEPPEADRDTATPLQTALPAEIELARGKASWYGPNFHGRLTSSGERFDMNELTAAHATLPLGTRVRVRNLANGREVVVRINDRFRRARNRVIDLSKAAAAALGFLGAGEAQVVLVQH